MATEAASVATANPTTAVSMSPAATDPPPSPSQAPTTQPTPKPTPFPVPPMPTGVTFAEERRGGDEPSSTEITQTVTWGAPHSDGVEIRVYGVTSCIARPADASPDTSGPCLVEHTPLPGAIRTLLGSAPASDGDVSWTWTGTFDCEGPGLAYDPQGPGYSAVVLAAYGPSGHSTFAIAEPGEWFQPGINETVC